MGGTERKTKGKDGEESNGKGKREKQFEREERKAIGNDREESNWKGQRRKQRKRAERKGSSEG